MKRPILSFAALAAAAAFAAGLAPPCAQAATIAPGGFTQRLIVSFREAPAQASRPAVRREQAQSESVRALGERKSVRLARLRESGQGAVVVALPAAVTMDEARSLATLLADDPAVAHAEPDPRVYAHQVPDPLFTSQWNLPDPAVLGGSPGAINVTRVWQTTSGKGITVAVIDTGTTSHPDLDAAWLPGHDFIGVGGDGTLTTANDGDGRDFDAADPGDWCTADGANRPSTWHGTSVASVIAAQANGYGIVGAAPGVMILPVRAIGRCGGYMSDVMDAMRWAAGLAVAGAPANPNPARVLNLSLGSAPGTACSPLQQQAINDIAAANVLVVAAAGNEGAAALGSPANCNQVLAIAAHTRQGELASYSNFNARVALTAPGGFGSSFSSAVLASGNDGTTAPGGPQPAAGFAGTSAATPHVVAAAALLWSLDPGRPALEIRSALAGGARPWPAGSACTTAIAAGSCGAGMLDVGAAIDRLSRQVAVEIAAPPGPQPGSSVLTLTATARSSYSSSQLAWTWSQTSGTPAQLAQANSATVRITLPPYRSTIGMRVTVTDPSGSRTIADTVINVNNLPTAKAVPPIFAHPGEAVARRIEASDPDGDRVRYTLLQAPPGMTIGRDDGNLQWTASGRGSQQARIAIEDADGLRGEDVEVLIDVGGGEGVSTASPLPGGAGGGGAVGWLELALLGLSLLALRQKGWQQRLRH